jgi:hypothetical protein
MWRTGKYICSLWVRASGALSQLLFTWLHRRDRQPHVWALPAERPEALPPQREGSRVPRYFFHVHDCDSSTQRGARRRKNTAAFGRTGKTQLRASGYALSQLSRRTLMKPADNIYDEMPLVLRPPIMKWLSDLFSPRLVDARLYAGPCRKDFATRARDRTSSKRLLAARAGQQRRK